jgi:hypothetical protein
MAYISVSKMHLAKITKKKKRNKKRNYMLKNSENARKISTGLESAQNSKLIPEVSKKCVFSAGKIQLARNAQHCAGCNRFISNL